MSEPFVSVIIPVFNDEVGLACCLEALQKQSYPRERFEALVVDNGSSDSSVEVASGYSFVKIAREPKPGSYAARNTGIAEARGEVLAFTDSDCIPRRDWLEIGVASLREQKNVVIVGNISMFAKEAAHPSSVELYDMAVGFPQKSYVEKWRFGPTANLIALKSTFDEVGLFDSDLKSCGDVQWGQRASQAGFELKYVNEVVVDHPARRSIESLLSKVRRIAGGVEDLQRAHPTIKHPMKTSLFRQLVPPVNYCRSVLETAGSNVSPIGKLKIIGLVLVVRYLGIMERLRLRLGGVSTRC